MQEYKPFMAPSADPATVCLTYRPPRSPPTRPSCTKMRALLLRQRRLKPTIDGKVTSFRQLLAEQPAEGRQARRLPERSRCRRRRRATSTSTRKWPKAAKAAVEERFGADSGVHAESGYCGRRHSNGGRGADYMLMWTALLEGETGLGEDFDFVCFAGPQDFARYSARRQSATWRKSTGIRRSAIEVDPLREERSQGGLPSRRSANYYALKASTAFSRGAHDEWNIVRVVNERRRNDAKLGIANQLPVLFDGRGVPSAESESTVSEGYVGKLRPITR